MTSLSALAVQTAPQTLSEALRHWARTHPDKLAVSQGDEEVGYENLDRIVEEAGQRLAGAGSFAGRRLALLGPNSVEWMVAFLAGLRIGAIVVPLNIRLSPLEIRRQLEVCEPQALLTAEALLPLVELANPTGRVPVILLDREAAAQPRSLWRLPRGRADEPRVSPAAPALISFTSGTIGSPKGAVIQHSALLHSASAFVPHLRTSATDTTLALVPLFHNTGFVDQLSQMMLVGGALDLLPEFRTAAAIDALTRRPASYLIAVPSIIRLLMLHERADDAFRHCRVLVYGGSSMPAGWIAELAERWPGIRLFNCYGLTEFTSVSHLLDPEYSRTRSDSVGRPVEGVRHQVVDDNGQPLTSGETGEVWLAGPMRMVGYWRAEAATRDAMRGEWLRTGDVGTIDGDFLTVLGRSAEVINRGGEKIYVAPIEAVLTELPAIADAAVVGAPHPIFQERVIAWVVAREKNGFDEEATRQHLAERIPDYAVPETFVVTDDLPRNASGKVDRVLLRVEAARLFAGDGH